MKANFAPSLGVTENAGLFKFWCQKVLPAVYDDSLSYYELLCKVVNHLNDVIKAVDGANENIEMLHKAYEELEKFVNTYFDENFEDAIKNGLDRLVLDGTLNEIINNEIFGELNKKVEHTYYVLEDVKVVTEYGAINDGIADCTESFERALVGGGNVYIPAGKYKISRALFLESNTILFGSGIIVDGVEERPDKNGLYGVINVYECDNCLISGIGLEGIVTADSVVAKCGICIENSTNVGVDKIKAVNTNYGSSVIEFIGSKHCWCSNSYVKEFGTTGIGCWDYCDNIKITDNTVINTTENNAEFLYGIVVSSMHNADSLTEYTYGSSNIICSRNYVSVNKWEAIDTHCGDNIIITDNIAISAYAGLVITGGSERHMLLRNSIISNNYVYCIDGYGIVVDGDNPVVTGNLIAKSKFGLYLRFGEGGYGINKALVSSNIVYASRYGITGGMYGKHIVIENNTIIGVNNNGTSGWRCGGYNLLSLVTDVLFKGNTIRGFNTSIEGPVNNGVAYHNSDCSVRLENNNYDVSTMTDYQNLKPDYMLSVNIGTPPVQGNDGDVILIKDASSGSPILLYCTKGHTRGSYNNTPATYVPFGANGW